MLQQSRYVVACCGAAFAAAAFLIGLEVSATTAATAVGHTPAAVMTVDRTLKSDRMSPGAATRKAVNQPTEIKAPSSPAPRPQLLDGCEPIVSAIGQPPLARVAGRCVS
jgi:hypothetical protein